MRIHLIEGEEGCRFAVERRAAAVIVDALRASATAAMLLDQGAREICVAREVQQALDIKKVWPDALLYGERGGLPPEGFDYGNSPAEAFHARGRRVIFTTTTGAGRLLSASGASAAFMATTLNGAALVRYARTCPEGDMVIIPAGLMGDPHFDAQEDRAASAWLAGQCVRDRLLSKSLVWGEGESIFMEYDTRIREEGLETLFARAPHAEKLRAVGMEPDIAFCARTNYCNVLPQAVAPFSGGVLLHPWPLETA